MRSRTLLLAATLARYWLTIWPLARRELRAWRRRADAIPDAELRRLALLTHDEEHLNAEGAAIFATLAPWRTTAALVRALVAYQVLFDYLDTITEGPSARQDDARQLHRALTDALDPASWRADWYALHPRQADGGYVAALVDACRSVVGTLPAFDRVGERARSAALRSGEVQALNHDQGDRARQLARWAATHAEQAGRLSWWEFAASASSSLAVHALLAMACAREVPSARAGDAEQAYCLMLGALNTLLESMVDLPRDRRTGDHSFASYYASGEHAATRISTIAAEAQRAAIRLPLGDRHAILLAGMAGFYLSTPGAWLPHASLASTRTMIALGPPTCFLVRLLQLRRLFHLRQFTSL